MTQTETNESLKLTQWVNISWRALAVSLRTKSKMSLFIQMVGFIMAFMPVWIAGSLQRFTDHVQMISQGQETVSKALVMFIILISLYLLQTAYTFAHDYYSEVDRQLTTKYIKNAIMECASRVQYKYIENDGDFREKLAFAEMFGGARVAASMQQSIIILQQLAAFLSIVTVLMGVSAWIVAILLIACIPAVILSMILKDEEYKEKTKSMKEGAMSVHLFYMASGANEQCKSLNDVRFYGIYPWIKEKWRKVSKDYLSKKNAVTKKHLLYNSIADILRNVVYIGILLMVAKQIYNDPALGLGIFMLVFTLSAQLQTTTTKLFAGAAQFISDIKYMRDFFELQDTPREKLEENPALLERADIVFDHVDFAYPNSTGKTLKNIHITIKHGEKIAIVGKNGSGKSTFINLLCGMHEPTAGQVKVNGIDVRNQLSTVRNAISVVFQHFGRYETSIRNNITISDSDRSVTDEELKRLAKRANAYSFIAAQPDGMDELVGAFSERGNNLSGGEWQKIAITRALYKEKAKIMILDEPTAALDPVSEAQLYRDFTDLTENKTTILVSHRMGITALVDRILVFEDGEIVEDGTHEQLLAKGGHYTSMYVAQAQWYKEELTS
ncbi:ABC transporter ATP-binding protein [Paenibacillus silviterrae]|uniref:ABC transporter ATP-binding protein n=1 Tax=Paenibacillus silviterrae TaxID=3242194 RepID=UPI002542B673|nr:ABC transporter ATP-binding protein [Paenibacillus chinjuensis]